MGGGGEEMLREGAVELARDRNYSRLEVLTRGPRLGHTRSSTKT